MTKITYKDIAFIKDNWNIMTYEDIANKIKCSKSAISKIAKKYKLPKKKIVRYCKYKDILTKKYLYNEYINNKKTCYQIAQECNIGYSTIPMYLKKYKIPIRSTGIKFTKKYLLKEYVNKGRSLTDISEEYGCTPVTVANYCKKYKIQINTTGGASAARLHKRMPSNNKLIDLYNNTHSVNLISQMLGCSHRFITQRLNKLGICTTYQPGELSAKFKGYKDISQKYYSNLKACATTRKYDFDITKKDIYNLYITQYKRCALTNIVIDFNPRLKINNTASVDRINNNIGYIISNILLTHKQINMIRNTLSISDFLSWCLLINKPLSHKTSYSSCIITKHGYMFAGLGNITKSYFNKVYNRRIRRNRLLDFNITIKDIWELFLHQKGYCALTGYPLQWGTHRNNYSDQTASLDRINSSQGYIEGNIQWVHKDINNMKWDLPQDEFIHWCKLVANHTSTPEWQEKYGYLLKDECATN